MEYADKIITPFISYVFKFTEYNRKNIIDIFICIVFNED